MSAIPQPSFDAPVSVPTRTPYVEVWRNSAQAGFTASAFTAFSFSEAFVDTHGFWSSAAPTRLTIPQGLAGVYQYELQWEEGAGTAFTGSSYIAVRSNGSFLLARESEANLTQFDNMRIFGQRRMSAGDYIEGLLFPATAASYTNSHTSVSANDPASPFMSLTRIGAFP